ncbi:Hypothetical protein HVR_LOCUS489 [uncultured virus]|nr:Hypothetical protein HVR_LOCUS489 [uncultured virus]
MNNNNSVIERDITRNEPIKITDEYTGPSNLRGGGNCVDGICGNIGCQTGPFTCNTQGSGCVGCLCCCIVWPFNCCIGATWGICNFLTCGSCSGRD